MWISISWLIIYLYWPGWCFLASLFNYKKNNNNNASSSTQPRAVCLSLQHRNVWRKCDAAGPCGLPCTAVGGGAWMLTSTSAYSHWLSMTSLIRRESLSLSPSLPLIVKARGLEGCVQFSFHYFSQDLTGPSKLTAYSIKQTRMHLYHFNAPSPLLCPFGEPKASEETLL